MTIFLRTLAAPALCAATTAHAGQDDWNAARSYAMDKVARGECKRHAQASPATPDPAPADAAAVPQ